MKLPASFSKRAAALCRAIAPVDLHGRACYVVPFSMVAARHPRLAAGQCRGWTGPLLDLTLRPLLDWEGRGFACIIRDDRLRNEHEALDITIHELAHGLSCTAPIAKMTSRQIRGTVFHAALELSELSARNLPDAIDDPVIVPWLGHELRFVRSALHVLHRAAGCGHRTTPQGACVAGDRYGLSSGQRYRQALGDEARDYELRSFRSILDTPAPLALSTLWHADTQQAAA